MSLDEKREGLVQRASSHGPRHSTDSPADSDYSLWSDTGDLVDQLADEEDPYRARPGGESYELTEGPSRGKARKKVRYQGLQQHEKRGRESVPKRKEDIRIPSPRRKPVGAAHRLLAAVMAPGHGPSRMHGLHGKKLM